MSLLFIYAPKPKGNINLQLHLCHIKELIFFFLLLNIVCLNTASAHVCAYHFLFLIFCFIRFCASHGAQVFIS